MKNKHIRFTRNAAALLVAFGTTTPAMAAVCNDVLFYATNTFGTDIRIDGVRYRDLNNGNPSARPIEDVPRFTCVADNSCVSAPQDLGSAFEPRENHDLTDIEYRYAFRSGSGWGSRRWSSRHTPNDLTCTDNRAYGYFGVP